MLAVAAGAMNAERIYRRWRSRVGPPRVEIPLLDRAAVADRCRLAVLFSAAADQPRMVVLQAVRMGVGLVALWVISRIPRSSLRLWTPWLFGAQLFLLASCRCSAPAQRSALAQTSASSICSRRSCSSSPYR